MAEHVLLSEIDQGVAIVTLNRPHARNALSIELRRALASSLAALDADDSVRAIVLTGADPAFCAGLDLKELSQKGLVADPDRRGPLAAVTKPVIGAVNGAAVAGGLELALLCDFLVASERARFADTHARVGVMPGWGLTVLLPQAIGIRRARQMSFTGNYVDASTALQWGLVNEVVEHDRLRERAVELAADMTTIGQASLAGIKAAYGAAAAPSDTPAFQAELAFARDWARNNFDANALAASREAIQARGRAQTR